MRRKGSRSPAADWRLGRVWSTLSLSCSEPEAKTKTQGKNVQSSMSLLKPNLETRLNAEWRLCLGRVVNLCFWSLRLKFGPNSASLAGTISIEGIDVYRISSRARMGLGPRPKPAGQCSMLGTHYISPKPKIAQVQFLIMPDKAWYLWDCTNIRFL